MKLCYDFAFEKKLYLNLMYFIMTNVLLNLLYEYCIKIMNRWIY